jgi:hypothetical protein
MAAFRKPESVSVDLSFPSLMHNWRKRLYETEAERTCYTVAAARLVYASASKSDVM